MKKFALCSIPLLALLACQASNPPSDAGTEALFVDPEPPTATISGYTLDPESLFLSAIYCGGETCEFGPPGLFEFSPLYQRSVVEGADIALVDPEAGPAAFAQSGANGSWTMSDVPLIPGFYIGTASGGSLPTVPGDTLPPIPAANYVPTLTLRPIQPSYPTCLLQETGLMSDNGVLEAVSKASGVSVEDLLNPGVTGGVVVAFLYGPGYPVRVPAFGARAVAEGGTSYEISLFEAPNGTESTRGFLVSSEPVGDIGVTAIVFPPGTPGTVLSFEDFVDSPPEGRPWSAEPLEIPIIPGMVSYIPMELDPAPPPEDLNAPVDQFEQGTPDFLCYPTGP